MIYPPPHTYMFLGRGQGGPLFPQQTKGGRQVFPEGPAQVSRKQESRPLPSCALGQPWEGKPTWQQSTESPLCSPLRAAVPQSFRTKATPVRGESLSI